MERSERSKRISKEKNPSLINPFHPVLSTKHLSLSHVQLERLDTSSSSRLLLFISSLSLLLKIRQSSFGISHLSLTFALLVVYSIHFLIPLITRSCLLSLVHVVPLQLARIGIRNLSQPSKSKF